MRISRAACCHSDVVRNWYGWTNVEQSKLVTEIIDSKVQTHISFWNSVCCAFFTSSIVNF